MKMMSSAWALVVTAGLLALPGCGERSENDLLATARSHVANRDSATAVIELKGLLQSRPESGEARLLLSQLLLEGGDAAGAETELQRALAAGQAERDVVPLLATALVAQDKQRQLVQEYAKVDLDDPLAAAVLKTQLATAYLAIGSVDRAEAAVETALKRAPRHGPALVLHARLKAVRGDVAAAQRELDAVLAGAPNDAYAWAFQGDLLRLAGPSNDAAAIEAYRQALSLLPGLVQAHSAILSMRVAQGDLVAASRQWETLNKALPEHAETRFFEALLALQRSDAQRAREITQALLQAAPDDPHLLLMAGQAELQLNSLAQAEAFLGKLVKTLPRAVQPRRLLATVRLRAGQADKALATLQPLLDGDAPDAEVLSLAAQAQLMTGDLKSADQNFGRALKLKPDSSAIRTAVALARLGKGQSAAAFEELAALAKTDTGTTADFALISARLNREEFDAALKALDALSAKQPNLALPDYLRGRVALQRRDAAEARKRFEAALAKEATFFPALSNLADLDMKDGNPAQARARFEALIAREPGNAAARLALAEVVERTGGGQQAVADKLKEAVRAAPVSAMARGALIDHYLATGAAKAALSAAQAAVAALPNNVEMLDHLGRALLLSGDTLQAIATYKKISVVQPKALLPQLRLVDAHLASYDAGAASVSAQRAIELSPDSLAAQQAGIAVAMQAQQPAQALAIARSLQVKRPVEPVGFTLEGEIELSQQHFDAAVAAFRTALSKPRSADAAPQLFLSLISAKKTAEADRFAEEWIQAHPDDLGFVFQLGSIALDQRDPALAESRFRQVLKRLPDNASALNNLALALIKQKKPEGLAMAEKAVNLAPHQAPMRDTLALAYADAKQLDKALAMQQRAVELAPQNHAMRLSLVKFKLQAGDRDSARVELGVLASLGPAYPGKEEVARLQRQLVVTSSVGPSKLVRSSPPPTQIKWFDVTTAVQALGGATGLTILLALLIAAYRPQAFAVKRSVVIEATEQQIFDLLQDLRRWELWSVWPQFGPKFTRIFSPVKGHASYCSWRNARKGAEGSVEIVLLTATSKLLLELRDTQPQECVYQSDIALTPEPGGATRVTWGLGGPATFWMRTLGVFYTIDRRIGKALIANLSGLKTAAASTPGDQSEPAPLPPAMAS